MRAALVSLVAGAAIGALLLALPPGRGARFWRLLPLHAELLLVGWLAQTAFGVAHWILPRLPGRPAERGRPFAAAASFLLLNLGVLSAGLGPAFGLPELAQAGRMLEAGAAVSFALHAWPRIRPPGPPPLR